MGGASGSQSSNSSSGYGESLSNTFGRSSSNSFADSFNQSDAFNRNMSTGDTFVDPAQDAARRNLFGQAQGAADADAATVAARRSLGATMPGLQSDFSALGAMTDPAAAAAGQKSALSSGLGHMFRTQINPAIEGDAIAAGGFGGGRQGVAQGVAAGEMANAYTQGAADIDAAAQARALQAAQMRSGLAGNMFDLGQGGVNAGLNTLGRLSEILGPATVLSRQRGYGEGGSTSTGGSTSRSRSQQRGGSTSKSFSGHSSKGKSASAGFSLFGS